MPGTLEEVDTILKTKKPLSPSEMKLQNAVKELNKFQLAVENASDQITISDPKGTIIYANKASQNVTGFSPAELVGTKVGEKWARSMEKGYYDKLWKTVRIDKKSFVGEIKNKMKDGTDYIADVRVSPILDDDKEVIFFVRVEHDITKAKEVDRMKTEFISLASHQLRTPLSAIKWYMEMVLDEYPGPLTKEQKEYLEKINISNERMIELVRALLNISRIESGRIMINPVPTDLFELVSGVIDELQVKIQEKEIDFIISVHKNLSEINLDPKLIRNVYMNLLTNAIKYTSKGGKVTVIISKKEGKVISQISDTGMGIPLKDHRKLFEKFFRSANVKKVETDGTGLGLYLVKTVVESSGGEVWFKSVEGEGSTFWFSLPIAGVAPKEGEVTLET